MRRVLPWIVGVGALWATAHSQSQRNDESPRFDPNQVEVTWDLSQPHVPGEILYSFEGPALAAKRTAVLETVGAVEEQELWSGFLYRMVLPEGADLDRALRVLNADPRLRYAEPNYLQFLVNTPNDPDFPSQWGFHQANDADIDAPEAWDVRTSAGNIIVGVIDTRRRLGPHRASTETCGPQPR